MQTRHLLDNLKRGYWAMRSSPVTRHIARVVYWFGLLAVIWFTVHYFRSTPGTGKAIAILGAAAVLMAIRGDLMGHPEKIVWMLVVFALLYVELRSIDKDRADNQKQQADVRKQEAERFNVILEENRKGIAAILDDQRQKFAATMQEFSKSQATNLSSFAAMMSKSNQIMGGVIDSVKTQTGGDSFAYISFAAQPAQSFEMHWSNFIAPKGEPYFVVSVTSHGKYPLSGTRAHLMDDDRRLAAMQEYNKPPDWGLGNGYQFCRHRVHNPVLATAIR